MRLQIVVAASFMASLCGAPAIAQEKEPPCVFRGLGSEYLVPNAKVAEEIYRAIAKALVPRNLKKYPVVVVEDKGDHWGVGQTDDKPTSKAPPGTFIVDAGGGQLYMSIDKCTGTMYDAALNR